MDKQSWLEGAAKKDGDAARLAEYIELDPALVETAIRGISSGQARLKHKCLRILNLLSRQKPELLYPYFDYFAGLLESPANIFKWNALDILAALTLADSADKFTPLISRYYGLLEQGSLITSAHVIENSPTILKAKPALEKTVTRALLGVESIPLPSEECRNILRGKAIQAFGQYFPLSSNQRLMLHFAASQTRNGRPATRKKAEEFIRKFTPGPP